MTPRELKALTRVYDQTLMRWAVERSMFANANFRGKGEAAYIPQDFLGGGNRNQRGIDEAKEQMAVMKANAALAQMKKDGPAPEGFAELFGE